MGGQTTKLWTLRQLPGTRISLGGAIRRSEQHPSELPSPTRRSCDPQTACDSPVRDTPACLRPQAIPACAPRRPARATPRAPAAARPVKVAREGRAALIPSLVRPAAGRAYRATEADT